MLILGAAIGGAIPGNAAWQTSWDTYGIGGVLADMLSPAGNFAKFVLVLLALSVIGNMAMSMYSVALCLQMLVPQFTKVPRLVFVVITMAVMLPVAIWAARGWVVSLENFLSVIGYWAGCFDAVILVELIVFRRMNFETFHSKDWDNGRRLPPGLAALGASLISLGVVVPGMDLASYSGPIGIRIGDIGFEAAFVITGLSYVPLRFAEKRWFKR